MGAMLVLCFCSRESEVSARARFFAPRLCVVKMSSLPEEDLEGRERAIEVEELVERREESWEAKAEELVEEITSFGLFLGRGMP